MSDNAPRRIAAPAAQMGRVGLGTASAIGRLRLTEAPTAPRLPLPGRVAGPHADHRA